MMFKTFKEMQLAAVFLGIATIGLALLYKLMTGEATTGVFIALCFVGVLFMLWYKIDEIKLVSFGKDGFKAELEVLREKTSENERTINELIFLSMGDDAFFNLQKLAEGNYGQYKKERHMGLETELYHLRNHGYIVLNKEKARSIHEIPEFGEQLSDYIQVTETGKQYIALREKQAKKL